MTCRAQQNVFKAIGELSLATEITEKLVSLLKPSRSDSLTADTGLRAAFLQGYGCLPPA